MSKHENTKQRVLSGTANASIHFDDLCQMLCRMGFRDRTNGSHRIFTKDGVAEIINLQPNKDGKAKPYPSQASQGYNKDAQFMKHEYPIQIVWSSEDEAYIAFAGQLDGCMADGATPEEAITNLRVIVQEWIETAKAEGRSVPSPMNIEDFARQQEKAAAQFQQGIQQGIEQAANAAVQRVVAQMTATAGQTRNTFCLQGGFTRPEYEPVD
jgi:predicted RNase H-like HicB family nuclease